MATCQHTDARTDVQDNSTCHTVYELSPAEAEWLEWHNRTSGQPADNVVIKIVTPKIPRPAIPGTPEQQAAWIHEYDGTGNILADYIQACRHKAIFGTWPDEMKGAPNIPKGVSRSKVQWLKGQTNWSKFLKWLGEVDPAAYDEFVERHYTARKWDIEINRGELFGEPNQDPVEQEVCEGMRRLTRKRLRHSLCVDASELRAWFQDNLGTADDLTWLANFQKLKAISEQIANLNADDLLTHNANRQMEGTRRQRERQQRLTWYSQKLSPDLPEAVSNRPGTTLAERVQARRDRRASERLATDQLIAELAVIPDDEPLPIMLTELAEAFQLQEC